MTGASHISAADFTVALLGEAERPKHSRTRFTVAYWPSSILRKSKVFHRSGRMWIAMLPDPVCSVALT